MKSAEGDRERITDLVSFYRKIYNVIALLITVGGLLCIPFLKYIVHTEKEVPQPIVLQVIQFIESDPMADFDRARLNQI